MSMNKLAEANAAFEEAVLGPIFWRHYEACGGPAVRNESEATKVLKMAGHVLAERAMNQPQSVIDLVFDRFDKAAASNSPPADANALADAMTEQVMAQPQYAELANNLLTALSA